MAQKAAFCAMARASRRLHFSRRAHAGKRCAARAPRPSLYISGAYVNSRQRGWGQRVRASARHAACTSNGECTQASRAPRRGSPVGARSRESACTRPRRARSVFAWRGVTPAAHRRSAAAAVAPPRWRSGALQGPLNGESAIGLPPRACRGSLGPGARFGPHARPRARRCPRGGVGRTCIFGKTRVKDFFRFRPGSIGRSGPQRRGMRRENRDFGATSASEYPFQSVSVLRPGERAVRESGSDWARGGLGAARVCA
jgi:hypothetical protein